MQVANKRTTQVKLIKMEKLVIETEKEKTIVVFEAICLLYFMNETAITEGMIIKILLDLFEISDDDISIQIEKLVEEGVVEQVSVGWGYEGYDICEGYKPTNMERTHL